MNGDGPTGRETLLQRCEDVSKSFLRPFLFEKHRFCLFFYVRVMTDGELGGGTDRWVEVRTDDGKETIRKKNGQTDRQTDRRTDGWKVR